MEAKKSFKKEQREAKELSVRNKRQRAATEKLYELAAENNIDLLENVIAQPSNVSMFLDNKTRGNKYMYVIPAADNSVWLVYDMIDANARILPNDGSIVVKPADFVNALDRGLQATTSMDGFFEIRHWMVLETLVGDDLFKAQHEVTQDLSIFAEYEQLILQPNSRAKLASYQGDVVWSLRCEERTADDNGGDELKECFAIFYAGEDGFNFDIVYEGVNVWILQQRVADRMIKRFAAENKLHCESISLLAKCKSAEVWAAYEQKNGGFVVVDIANREVSLVPYGDVSFNQEQVGKQRAHQQFEMKIKGICLRAMPWLEFNIIAPEEVE